MPLGPEEQKLWENSVASLEAMPAMTFSVSLRTEYIVTNGAELWDVILKNIEVYKLDYAQSQRILAYFGKFYSEEKLEEIIAELQYSENEDGTLNIDLPPLDTGVPYE